MHFFLASRSLQVYNIGAMATATTTLHTCGKCDGKGKIDAFSHIENGKCFWCGGTGKVEAQPEDVVSSALANARWLASDALDGAPGITRIAEGIAAELHKVGTDKARDFLGSIRGGRYFSEDEGRWKQAPAARRESLISAIIEAGRVAA